MEIIHSDSRIAVCIKPAGVLSTDEPGGMPSLLRAEFGGTDACIRTVHRLDRPVGGLMVFARSRMAASLLSGQIRSGSFEKEYFAVIHGQMDQPSGILEDLLARDSASHRTYVTQEAGKQARPARLFYETLGQTEDLSLVRIRLDTGRTHQIRVQFASRNHPLYGDSKYGAQESDYPALWSCQLRFDHPQSGERLTFFRRPPDTYPWNLFSSYHQKIR